MKKQSRRLLAMLLAVIMIIPVSGIAASAASTVKFSNGEYQATKITNPTKGSGETDGILYGDEADRMNNYAWSLAERNGDVYVGVNRNIYGGYFEALYSYAGVQLDEETKWLLFDTFCNGEFPHRAPGEANKPVTISKINQTDGTTKVIYTSPEVKEGIFLDSGYRMMISYGENIYVGTASAIFSRILRIGTDDNVTSVHQGGAASSFRAATIHNNKLYFGGIDSYKLDPETDALYNNYGIYEMNPDDDTQWSMVANYKDFGNIGLKTGYAGELWDIASYNGYIYVSFWGTKSGFALYKGQKVEGSNSANAYGWEWTEIIGENTTANGGYKFGMVDDNRDGYVACGATPVVFNDELYFGTFDGSMKAFITSIMVVLGTLSGSEAYANMKLSDIMRPLYETITAPQKLYKLDKNDVIIEVEGINKYLENTANDYLWRYEVYNDELYIGSFDCANIYTYITQFTDGRFFKMTPEELASQAEYIVKLINTLTADDEVETQATALFGQLDTVLNSELKDGTELKQLNGITALYNKLVGSVGKIKTENTVDEETVNKIMSVLSSIWDRVDVEGLELCYEVNEIIAKDDLGFDLISTKDGVNFTAVTTNGFGDKYNYGCRTLLTTSDGLLVGTANPYYGAQVWKLTSGNEPVDSLFGVFERLLDAIASIWEYYIPAAIRNILRAFLPLFV